MDIIHSRELKNRLLEANKEGSEGIKDDETYCYAVGQVFQFFNLVQKGAPLRDLNRLCNCATSEDIKKILINIYKKVNHNIYDYHENYKNLISLVMLYEAKQIDDSLIVRGEVEALISYKDNKK